ncbi:hypothetical protein PILCRDRAFT_3824 [Piloderma croceum F 1598]|uniref:Uncharacterized protein n=1 Tax=Piloderma croceum (strain F 1598) TaxID=765440 RepID=A0A0C3FSZ2_PILCF|nr:hypothetical protein PILCRDRAFT_3824 [Piloderma croceum F 1598]
MYTTTRTINFGLPLGPAESYVRSSSIFTEVVQGRYLRPEAIGQKMDVERITFQTFNGDPGVWLFDVLHGTAVIESPDTKYGVETKAYQMLSLKWPGYLHFSVGFTETLQSYGRSSSGYYTRIEILKATAELIHQFIQSAVDVGHDGEADWWTIGRDGVDIEHVRIMSLDWRHDDGIVLVPRLWIAGKAEPRGQNM